MDAERSSVVVRLQIFSGRPDPEWSLDEDSISQLRSKIKNVLAENVVDQAPFEGLGYRGFLVKNPGKTGEILDEFVVFNGVLIENPGPKARYLRDTAGIEEFLLAEARSQGFGKYIDAMSDKGQK